MAFEIEWLESAQNELDAEIAFVLNEFGFKAAQKAYLRIQAHINCLATFPLIGTIYPKLTYKDFEIRKFVIRQVIVFYSPQPDKVTILALWNNYQNPANIPYRLSDLE